MTPTTQTLAVAYVISHSVGIVVYFLVLLRGLVFIIIIFYCVDWLVFLCLEVALLE